MGKTDLAHRPFVFARRSAFLILAYTIGFGIQIKNVHFSGSFKSRPQSNQANSNFRQKGRQS
jgi:hypothetical protein